MTAPDGDLGFFGRSQELSWSLSYAAFAAQEAIALPGSSGQQDGRWQALSDRMVSRLRDDYGVGPNGLYVLPALRDFKGEFFRGRDGYVGATSFNGLTLLPLDWAARAMAGAPRSPGELLGDRDGERLVSFGEGRYAVVRRGSLWWAIKQTTSAAFRHHPEESALRSDTGVVALKELDAKGRWRDLMPLRPRTTGTAVQSLGPILRRSGRRGRRPRLVAPRRRRQRHQPHGLPYPHWARRAAARPGTCGATGSSPTARCRAVCAPSSRCARAIASSTRRCFASDSSAPRTPAPRSSTTSSATSSAGA